MLTTHPSTLTIGSVAHTGSGGASCTAMFTSNSMLEWASSTWPAPVGRMA